MMKHRIPRNVFALTLVLILSACSSNKMYRSDYKPCDYQGSGTCAKNALQVHAQGGKDEYHLGFVEYDDQGQLRDPQQMRAVLDQYLKIAAAEDVLLVTFVHGWHHSAQPEDGNIASFRDMLAKVSRMESLGSEQDDRKKRKILGLYVGWRGDSISIPYVNDLTFWDRKSTAHDVGQHGVSELLLKLEQIINIKAGIEEENPPPLNSRLVVIGHSFGGAVVYGSLQKILIDRFIDSRRGQTYQGDANGFGDLVVLMNPAFEALRFATLYDLSQQSCRRYFPTQLPKLVILTSEADYATKYAFPAGRSLSTVFEAHVTLDRYYCSKTGPNGKQAMKIKEGAADRTAVGHFSPYITHRLNPASNQITRSKSFQIRQIQAVWAEHTNATAMNFPGSQLESLQRSTAFNPYLNIQVDKTLINDHNDIWRPEIAAFISDLIVISTTPGASEKK